MCSFIDKIFSKELLNQGYYSFLFAFLSVVVMPIHVQYLPPFMIMWCLSWIVENLLRRNEKWNLKITYKVLFFLFISYYAWQAVGLLYTYDIKMGFSNLFGRLSLIMFPLVLIFPGEMIINKARILIRTFAVSTFLYMFFCFGYALCRSIDLSNGILTFNPHLIEYPWLNYFYSAELTLAQHPSYISMYVLLSVFICFESWFDHSSKIRQRLLWLISGTLLLLMQYFISSRAGILASLILVPLYFLFKVKKSRKNWITWSVIIVVFICVIPLLLKNARVDSLFDEVFNRQVGHESQKDPRFLIWKSTLKISQENFLFGVGIGDSRTELVKEFKQIGEEKMANERFNAHNQFLEVLLESGIIGLLIFLGIFGYMISIAFSEKNQLYGLFIIIIFGFFMFETILYRLAGVSFFSLFSFLLLHIPKNNAEIN
ncbi:MAG: O-antigen ligase family protein [Bacteroidales bacterium]|nr:O-antigen ligase family protein [Bacteroidales bacterium]